MTECRKKGRERGSEGEERKGEWSEEEEKKGKDRKEGREKGGGSKESESALGERGARSTCTLYERNPRRRRWAFVHFMHAYARLSRIPCTTTTDSSMSGLRFGPICSIFY